MSNEINEWHPSNAPNEITVQVGTGPNRLDKRFCSILLSYQHSFPPISH